MRRLVSAIALSLVLSPALHAQMAMGGTRAKPIPAGSVTAPAQALDDMLSLFEREVVPLVKAMPADKFNFAPESSTFAGSQSADFKGVRSFGQQVAHLAQANFYFFSVVSGTRPDMDVKSIAKMTSKDELINALTASFAFGHKAVQTVTPDNAFLTIDGVDGMHTRTTVAAFAVAHGFDHYGQLVEYARMNGIIPPASVTQ